MARLARVVAAGHPHHVTQRGNRRLPTCFSAEDDEATLGTMRRHGRTGRPWGSPGFIERLEGLVGRRLRKGKPVLRRLETLLAA